MDNQASSKLAQAEAEEIFRSWLDAVELFLKTDSGRAILNEHAPDMQNVFRAALAAQVRVPEKASPELAKAVKDLRFKKRQKAKIKLDAVLFFHDKNDRLEREWVALEAEARGNVSSVKRVVLGNQPYLEVASPKPAFAKEPLTMPAPPIPGRSTIPVPYSQQALMDWKESGKIPSLEKLLGTGPIEEVIDEEAQVETRRAILPPPSDQEDAPQIEIEEYRDAQTPASEMDLIFEDFLDDK